MGKVKMVLKSIARLWYVKYLVVVVLGVSFVCFLDDNSLWAHLRNKQRISELNDEIEQYQQAYERDQSQLQELQHNPKAMEKIARERYFMKADDEDIFVMSEGEIVESGTNDKTTNDETAN